MPQENENSDKREGWTAEVTCWACPLQIEGMVEGKHLYFRDRHGCYDLGIGPTPDDAVRRAMDFIDSTGWRTGGSGDLTEAEAYEVIAQGIEAWRAAGRPMVTVTRDEER